MDSIIKLLQKRDMVKDFSANSVYIPVKKDTDADSTFFVSEYGPYTTSLLEHFDHIISVCESTSPSIKKNESLYFFMNGLKDDRENLVKLYPKKTRFGNKNDLEEDHRLILLENINEIYPNLIGIIAHSGIMLNLDPWKSLNVEKKSLKILDKSAKLDLTEGFTLLQSGHTTSAYMIFMRVAEFLVLQYYKKITGYYPKNDDAAWGQMLFSLQNEYKSKIDKNFANLLYFLKDKRNEAQHPGKRFTEKDCDKLIMYLTEYVDYFAKQK
jgi:hypothetical protein